MGRKLVIVLLVAAALAAYWLLDLNTLLDLEQFNQRRAEMAQWVNAHPLRAGLAYAAVYILVTTLSLPGAAIMTLIGGALFGFGYGLLLVSFASSIGATLAFLVARGLLRDWVQRRFSRRLAAINQGIERDGAFYLFTLRLVPVFPFFLINLALALTPIRTWTFYWVSQVGMLAGTAVYVNAGTQLADIKNPGDILAPELWLAFVLLGLFPWLARGISRWLSGRRALGGFAKPKRFDANLIVIGAGSAGLVTAYIAAQVKAKVLLIESHRMGGDCLNTGCVPSKTLIRSARVMETLRRSREFGIQAGAPQVDFSAVMERVRSVIQRIEPHDSVARYTELGVDCLTGEARLVSPWEVEVDGRRMSARRIVLATGAGPAVPDIPGLGLAPVVTSDNVWQLQQLPARLVVLGGGPVGCELAQAFARLGSQVTLVVRSRLLPKDDADMVDVLRRQFAADGIQVLESCQTLAAEHVDGTWQLRVAVSGDNLTLPFDTLLVAAGRIARTQGLGLDALGIRTNDQGFIATDARLRTDCPTVYACGDAVGPHLFTHVAAHQAWYAAVNALFGARFAVDYRVIPRVTYTDPELAQVGLNEQSAQDQGIAYEVTRYDLEELDRAIADGANRGFVKVLTRPGRDHILGVGIVGYHASELLAEYVLAMKQGIGLNKILGTIHSYPTWSEANKYAAGEWRKAHKPQALLRWAERLQRWRRG